MPGMMVPVAQCGLQRQDASSYSSLPVSESEEDLNGEPNNLSLNKNVYHCNKSDTNQILYHKSFRTMQVVKCLLINSQVGMGQLNYECAFEFEMMFIEKFILISIILTNT